MKELRRTTLRLTMQYSLVFFGFVWLLSGGIYVWVDGSLGEGYVNRINNSLEQQHSTKTHQVELSDSAASIASDITLDNLRNILLVVNGVALIGIPLLAYWISRRSLRSLIESQQAQQRFVAHASHELRTPLAVMSGELELAAKQPRSIKEYQRTIAATYEETQRMTTLVRELLLLARVSQDSSVKFNMEPVAVNGLLEEIVTTFQSKAKQKHIRLRLNMLSEQDLIVQGKHDLLTIVLANLVDNAIKFANPRTTVLIELAIVKHNVHISVQDEGELIDKDKLTYIFDRFYQAKADHGMDGFGLGLAIAKQIVDLHHGTITVKSDAKHTVFIVKLPHAN